MRVVYIMVGLFLAVLTYSALTNYGAPTWTPTHRHAQEDDPVVVRDLAKCHAVVTHCWVERDSDGQLGVYGR